MIDSTSGAGGLTPQLFASESPTNDMGQDAFLKLLVAQLRHQDPLKPMENTEFVSELAQFSALEQSVGTNARLELLATQTRGLANTEAVQLVGNQVTVRGNLVSLDGSGAGSQIQYELDASAATTTVTIRDVNGRVVRIYEDVTVEGGAHTLNWDGKSDAGIVQPEGVYSVTVEAFSESGAPVGVSQQTTGVVEAISFDKGYPILHLDTGAAVPASDLLRVEQRDSGAEQEPSP